MKDYKKCKVIDDNVLKDGAEAIDRNLGKINRDIKEIKKLT